MSERLPSGGTELSPDEIEALDARWSSSWTPGEVARRLDGVGVPWCVAAGWALDLFGGAQTRVHGDIEIAIPEAGFPEVRSRFPGYVFDAAYTRGTPGSRICSRSRLVQRRTRVVRL